jgi:peroxiredoxin
MKRLTTILLLALLPLGATMAQKSTFTATLKGVDQGVKVIVCEPQGGRLVPVDTLTPDKKGRFTVERNSTEPQFFALALTIDRSPMVHAILLPKEKVTAELYYNPDANFMGISETKGSENMELYKGYTDIVSAVIADPSLQVGINEEIAHLLDNRPDVLMSAFLVTYFEQAFDQYAALYKKIRDSLTPTYANHDFVRHIEDKLRTAVVSGMEAPDIVMADRDGKTRRLSDLRGKVVLIDFWASWCRPCRAENPNVVRLYHQYKDKGFDIFSVSLDNSRDKWLQAIDADGLVWENHVSDLRGWSSAGGRLYGINSIPATVLIDRDGKVLARNLRGQELENKLKELFGK